jgi:hypothetical protein
MIDVNEIRKEKKTNNTDNNKQHKKETIARLQDDD